MVYDRVPGAKPEQQAKPLYKPPLAKTDSASPVSRSRVKEGVKVKPLAAEGPLVVRARADTKGKGIQDNHGQTFCSLNISLVLSLNVF